MSSEIVKIPLTPLTICGIIGVNMGPLCQYNLTAKENRHDVIADILTEFATKDVVILGNTLIKTESFDGFRII